MGDLSIRSSLRAFLVAENNNNIRSVSHHRGAGGWQWIVKYLVIVAVIAVAYS